ncbi:MAG: DUF2889 domain-containing protein [bacterium]
MPSPPKTPTSKTPTPEIPRKLIHTRTIVCQGFLREDGLWDIEGHITDVKTYEFDNPFRGIIGPGIPIHEMVIRLTMDDALEVRAVNTTMDHTPYPTCPEVALNFQRLVGLRIRPGWRRQVRERLGGAEGCTHMVELLSPLATTAFQTIIPYQRFQQRQSLEAGEVDITTHRPRQIDTCYSWASNREVVRRYLPDFYTGEATGTD